MSVFHAIILGIVQGLTEFLPISSDGHLVLADILLRSPLQGLDALGFDILLHAGSLLAIFIAYAATWKALVVRMFKGERDAWMLIGLLVIATVPGVIAGLLFEDAIGGMRSLRSAGAGFIITAIALMLGEYIGRTREKPIHALHDVGVTRALLAGIAQAIAILPGVSRSGLTISLLRAAGLHRALAVDFSFMMAAPIIAGAVAKTLVDAWQGTVVFPAASVSFTGFLTSFIVSLCAIALLRLIVLKKSLVVFVWYLVPLGVVLLWMS
jgi:undecaprenyl-diphosphatase